MSITVALSPLARDDLIGLHRWIAEEADGDIADAYLDRVLAKLGKLADFPNRGTPRDDLATGVRTLPFERRLIIAYHAGTDGVLVLRIVSAARDLSRIFAGRTP